MAPPWPSAWMEKLWDCRDNALRQIEKTTASFSAEEVAIIWPYDLMTFTGGCRDGGPLWMDGYGGRRAV